jgi:DNA-directed RNA polymerase subunit omega
MARAHDTMMNPAIEDLLDTVDSKFSLVTLAARRERQINSYFNQLGDGLGHMVPPQVSSIAQAVEHRVRRNRSSQDRASRAPDPETEAPADDASADTVA